jgi:HD superfamily phosphohydrolase
MEGTIGVDRIISMLTVHEDQLVVEEKGIYSIENFLNARRLMYWQVYLHKTTVCAERMLVNLIKRAQYLVQAGEDLPTTSTLSQFLSNQYSMEDFKTNMRLLDLYGHLDDNDIWGAIKKWQSHPDSILSILATMLDQRKLFQISLTNDPINKEQVESIKLAISKTYKTLKAESNYLISFGTVTNEAYTDGHKINILMRSGELLDIAQASDLPNIKALGKIVKKNYLCWPKNVSL